MTATLHPFELPLSTPLETSTGTIEKRTGWVLSVNDGTTGLGEATPLAGFTESRARCESTLDSVIAALENEDWRSAFAATTEMPAARHALASALLDVRARQNDRPLYRELGGDQTVEHVPVHATIGAGAVAETVARATEAVDAGFETLKLKVGTRPLEDDLNRVAAVRSAVGSAVDIRVDANGAWDPETASHAIDELAAHDVSLVEQPLPADDLAGHRDLRGTIPIALDESLVEHGPTAVLDADAADALVLKPMALGGPDVARGVAITAHRSDVDVLVSNTIDGAIARTAAVHLAASLPAPLVSGLATASLLERDVAPDPSPLVAGTMAVPQTPGLGVSEVTVDA